MASVVSQLQLVINLGREREEEERSRAALRGEEARHSAAQQARQ